MAIGRSGRAIAAAIAVGSLSLLTARTGYGAAVDGSSAATPTAARAAVIGYRVYTNRRFGFTARRPAGFTAQSPPEDGDGRAWTTDAGHVSLAAYGANNVNHLSAREQAAADARAVHVAYRNISGDVVTVSGYTHRGRVVIYRRDIVGAGSIDTLVWQYPTAQKRRWDRGVTTTARAFRPGDVTKPH